MSWTVKTVTGGGSILAGYDPEVEGSNPSPATEKEEPPATGWGFFSFTMPPSRSPRGASSALNSCLLFSSAALL